MDIGLSYQLPINRNETTDTKLVPAPKKGYEYSGFIDVYGYTRMCIFISSEICSDSLGICFWMVILGEQKCKQHFGRDYMRNWDGNGSTIERVSWISEFV
jgi:hypothetical protein